MSYSNNNGELYDFSNFCSAVSGLKSSIFLTLLVIALYRFGTYIPMPFVDFSLISDFFGQSSNSGFLGIANTISGGALGRFSVFSLNVMPYILSSIVVQLFFSPIFSGEKEKTNRDRKRSDVEKYTKYCTILFATLQSIIVSFSVVSVNTSVSYHSSMLNTFFLYFVISLTLVTGTMLLIWLGELITSNGIGNGISVIIFVGIVSELPKSIYSTLELERLGAYSGFFVFFILVSFIALLALVVFVERSARNVVIHYSRKQVSNKVYSRPSSSIPIKINVSGVIPAIFANTIIHLPFSLSVILINIMPTIEDFIGAFYSNKLIYYFAYTALIVFFSFFYTSIVFDTDMIADNIRKSNGFIVGRRPGKNTSEYLSAIVKRITAIGAMYLAFICVAIDIFRAKYSIPFALGGTSMLIIVGVVTEIVSQIQMSIFDLKYDALMRKMKFK